MRNVAAYWNEKTYRAVAAQVRAAELKDPTPEDISHIVAMKMGIALPADQITPSRLNRIKDMLRSLDATQAVVQAHEIAKVMPKTLEKAATIDLILRGIVKSSVETSEDRILASLRQLLQAQTTTILEEIRASEARMYKAFGGMEAKDIPEEVPELPALKFHKTSTGVTASAVAKRPRIVVWGPKANQKDFVLQTVREKGLANLADITVHTSAESVSHIGRGYDFAVVQTLFTKLDERRDLRNHAATIVEVPGALSLVCNALEAILIGIKADAMAADQFAAGRK